MRGNRKHKKTKQNKKTRKHELMLLTPDRLFPDPNQDLLAVKHKSLQKQNKPGLKEMVMVPDKCKHSE